MTQQKPFEIKKYNEVTYSALSEAGEKVQNKYLRRVRELEGK